MKQRFASSVFLSFVLSLFSLFGHADQPAATGYLPVKSGEVVQQQVLISREQALADVLREAKELDVEIRSNQEAEEYLDYAARMSGVEAHQMHAATLGPDLIMIRGVHKHNPRILREELLHTQQQKAGVPISQDGVTNAEIEVRQVMIKNRYRWGITEEEVQEMRNDIELIERRGGY